jgi:dienelactone hydrolase
LLTHAPARAGDIKGLVAAYNAGRDFFVPPSDVDAFRSELLGAGVPFHITEFSQARHGFTDPEAAWHDNPNIAFDPLAEAVSWAGTVALLQQELR